MNITLPDTAGRRTNFELKAQPITAAKLGPNPARTVYSAAHVVADPFAAGDPTGPAQIDWHATMAFRHYLADLGLGIAEAMDTAQRGMGLDWPGALELIRRTREELPNARIGNGCGTDQLDLKDARSLDDVRRAYMEQLDAIQSLGGDIILMASRALAKVAVSADDYIRLYGDILSACDNPVILHWLGKMFDPALAGYWGTDDFEQALETVLQIIVDNRDKVDGIKISLLDKDKEIALRRRLPDGVKMYTGDDFNYPELIAGDAQGYSHALLGIFDPLAPIAARAVAELGEHDTQAFRQLLDPTVPLARHIFKAPTQFYKTGVVFLAWLNGFQDHFIMLDGAQAKRALPHFVELFKLADSCGALRDPELAIERMKKLLALYGV
ncbi:dihydrodipicolinate synthase family protein [Halomonas dongshanensis]|uniref:Dihydrodipicolinate synthase family protein n=1 Tax=Halomonas dongshanensis TaxID=2890835 RepID=A0ABT2EB19_9GAMM|nr:dihydrodipicolinate synthase family protein [Halomonas dongshanensis]MCS2608745.1 dihydrodipicolinate synthase family protein [Halomonas dongshanensis]